MNKKKLLIWAVFWLILGIVSLNAQEIVLTSGCNTLTNGGSICFSVGQVSYSSFQSSFGFVSEGVLHADITVGINEIEGQNLRVLVYPNPTESYITLIVDVNYFNNLSYQLYDLAGRKLIDKKITDKETLIDLQTQSPSFYILKILTCNQKVRIFKIIKK